MVIVQNQQDKVTVTERLESVSERAAEAVLSAFGPGGGVELGITFVDDIAIQDLNRRYRGKDEPTDVLSFLMQEEELQADGTPVLLLGDVVVSLETAVRWAMDGGQDLVVEVAQLVIHGTLHLLGCDHEATEDADVMQAREKEIIKGLAVLRVE